LISHGHTILEYFYADLSNFT